MRRPRVFRIDWLIYRYTSETLNIKIKLNSQLKDFINVMKLYKKLKN